MAAGLILVVSASNNLTSVDFLELFCIAIGLMLLPWASRTYYMDPVRPKYRNLYALGLILLLALPQLALMEFNPRNYVSSLLLAFYGIPLTRVRRRGWWLWFALLSILFSLELLPLAINSMEGGALTTTGFQAIFQTSPGEAREYLTTHFHVLTALPFAAGALFLGLLCRAGTPSRNHKRVVSGVLTLSMVSLCTGVAPEVVANYKAFQKEVRSWEAMANKRHQGLEAIHYWAKAPARSRKILLVVGESTTRRHMGLYGYSEPTTPRLQALKDRGELFAFDQVISPHCMTMQCLEKVLTTSNNENHIPFTKSVSLLEVCRKAGFRTFWVSNQTRIGFWDDQVSVLSHEADEIYFTKKLLGIGYNPSPDEVIFPLVDRLLPKGPGNVLFICHLMGAHFDYNLRVPESQRLKNIQNPNGSSSYDQAIRYGDSVLADLIQKANAASFDMVVYLSDHGECPHNGLGHNDGRFDPEMCEIPFLIWLSKETRKGEPHLVERIQAGMHRPFMTDGFFHTMLDLAGVDSSLLDPSRSVVSPRFQPRPRSVLNGKIPYVPGSWELHDQEKRNP